MRVAGLKDCVIHAYDIAMWRIKAMVHSMGTTILHQFHSIHLESVYLRSTSLKEHF